MALATNGFMTATGITSGRSVTSRMDKIDIESVLKSVLIKDTALLGKIPIRGVAKNTEHRWLEDSLNSVCFYGTLSTSVKLIVASPSTTAKLQKIVRTNSICYADGGDFYFKFGSAPVFDTNVIAAYGNTSFTAAGASTKFMVAAMPKSDLAAASSDISKTRTTRRNFTQVFERGIQIAETREHIDLYAVGSELELQTKYRTMEMKRELGISVINGFAYYSSGGSDNTELRTMAGIIQQIRNPTLTSSNADATVTDASTADLTADHINDTVKLMFDLGGFPDDHNVVMVVGAKQAQKISNMATENLRGKKDSRVRGFYADTFQTDFAGIKMPILLDRWVPNDKVLLVDLNRIALLPLQGDTWSLEEKASTGRSRNFQTSGQYTLVVENAGECHGMIHNLKTT